MEASFERGDSQSEVGSQKTDMRSMADMAAVDHARIIASVLSRKFADIGCRVGPAHWRRCGAGRRGTPDDDGGVKKLSDEADSPMPRRGSPDPANAVSMD